MGEFTPLNAEMIDECRIGKDVERSGYCLRYHPKNLFGVTEENDEQLQSDQQMLWPDLGLSTWLPGLTLFPPGLLHNHMVLWLENVTCHTLTLTPTLTCLTCSRFPLDSTVPPPPPPKLYFHCKSCILICFFPLPHLQWRWWLECMLRHLNTFGIQHI
jgi:hypothetical protein